MRIYLVGGAVRDRLLGLPVRDRDWVVVGGKESEMLERGYRRADSDFPVFLHPQTGEEYALARRETKTGPGYKGFSIEAGPDVTLEQDLIRRDLTINAIAEDEAGKLIDPFDGHGDLNAGVLRHISPAFIEDPVRLLRVARFAARLGRWGFRISHGTHKLMQRMAASTELETLSAERVWLEMRQALAEDQPWRFFQVLQRCGALAKLIPALEGEMLQQSAHAHDAVSPMVVALQRAVRLDAGIRVRFAVAFHDAAVTAGGAKKATAELRVEREYLELLKLIVRLAPVYSKAAAGDPPALLDLIESTRALHDVSRLKEFLTAADALWPELSGTRGKVMQALDRVAAITPGLLQSEGMMGAELGRALRLERLNAVRALLDQSGAG